jgi:serine/threonine protein kinase
MAFSLQDYEFIEPIGHGGFSSVFKARQRSLNRLVAIKRLAPEKAQDAEEVMRFRREAQATASIHHDNIISIHDYGYQAGNYYLVIEYINGLTFQKALELSIPLTASLFALERTTDALKYAHLKKIIHRDLKPNNIFLGSQGQVKLADFGLSSIQAPAMDGSSKISVIGTLAYMSPEAMHNPRDLDYRTDIFSLGCILYQVLEGKKPFPGTTMGEVSYKILNLSPPPFSSGQHNDLLKKITLRCLSKEREKRPEIDELAEILKTSIGDYSQARSALLNFVQGNIQAAFPPAEYFNTQPSPSTKKRTRRTAIITAFIALTIGLFTGFFLLKPEPIDEDPLDSVSGKFAIPFIPANTSAFDTATNWDSQNPRPITTDSTGLKSGTLFIKGLSDSAEVFMNGKLISRNTAKSSFRAEFEPGSYYIEIHEPNKKRIKRTIDLMPHQTYVLEIGK